ncbi:hypothetical protein SAMN05660859_2681, partial [Ancylobacter rudongensis]
NTQVIPASWVRESTTTYSSAKRIRQGYGYLWWTLPEDIWGKNAFYASGYGGQIIAVVPAKRLVVVQTVDLSQNPKGVRTSAFIDFLKAIASASRQRVGPQRMMTEHPESRQIAAQARGRSMVGRGAQQFKYVGRNEGQLTGPAIKAVLNQQFN